MTMQQTKQKKKKKKLLGRHSHPPQAPLSSSANPKFHPHKSSFPVHHHHQTLSSSASPSPSPTSPSILPPSSLPPRPPLPPFKRNTPDPPTATTTTTTTTSSPPPPSNPHKEKLLKLILKKVPHLSPSSPPPPRSPSSTPPLSRLSPHHLAPVPSPSRSPSPCPSPLSHPSSRFHPPFLQQQTHLQKRPKLAAELQPDDTREPHTHLKQIKRPTPNPKQLVQDLHQKSHHLRLVHKGKDHSSSTPQKEQEEASSPDNSAQLIRSKFQERKEHQEDQRSSHSRNTEKNFSSSRQLLQQEPNLSRIKGACPILPRQQQNSPNPSFEREDEFDPTHDEQEGQLSHSRTKRPETKQLDVGAILDRPLKQQQQHAGDFYPKTVKRHRRHHHKHHHCEQEQTQHCLGSVKIQKQLNSPGSPHQQPGKKLTHKLVQGGPYGLHENHNTILSSTAQSPPPRIAFPPFHSSTPQSDGPSLSASAISDERDKPSKKRKLRSLLKNDCAEGVSTINGKDDHSDGVSPSASTPPTVSPVARPDPEGSTIQDAPAASSSPKATVNSSAPALVPAKKLLTKILDKLQKKDKYGVFGEPVDPKEVPNYYDIIKCPMDFGTMRKRITSGHYRSIQLFETDIFLLCNNAMEYNGKGTVYFRHARAIKDVAERILEEVKVMGLAMEVDEPTAVRQRVGSHAKGSEKLDTCTNVGSPGEARVDMQEEFSGYFLRSVGGGDGRRFHSFDENRRHTYNNSLQGNSFQGNDSLLNVVNGDFSHVMPTGYPMDFSYGKSLARFAADLGPFVWKIAAEKIKKTLHPGFPFGPGWVGEREATGGMIVAPSAKQQSSSVPSTPKSIGGGGAVMPFGNTLVEISSNKKKPEDGQANQEIAGKLDGLSSMEATVQPNAWLATNQMRSPVVFGNPLRHHERLDRPAEMSRVLGNSIPGEQRLDKSAQHNERSDAHNHKDAEPHSQSDPPVHQGSIRSDRSNVAVTRSGTPVNLNHPLSFQSDDVEVTDNQVSSMDALKEENTLGRDGIVNISMPGSVSRTADSQNPVTRDSRGSTGSNAVSAAPGNHIDSRAYSQLAVSELSRVTTVNGNSIPEASTSNRSNGFLHYDAPQSSQGLGPPPFPLQQSARSRVNVQDVAVVNSGQLNSSHSDSRGLLFPHNVIMPFQHTTTQKSSSRSQHSILNPMVGNHGSFHDSLEESPSSKLAASPFHETTLHDKSRNASEGREASSNSLDRIPSNAASITPTAGFFPDRGFTVQQFEHSIGRQPVHDKAYATNQNTISTQKKQSASQGTPTSNFLPARLTSNGASRVQEDLRLPGWATAQQPDPMAGKRIASLQSKVSRSSEGFLETSTNAMNLPSSMGLQSVKLQGVDNGHIFAAGNSKPNLNLPHFLQQQQQRLNGAQLPSQLSNGAHLPSQLSNGAHMPSQPNNMPSQPNNGAHMSSQHLLMQMHPPSNSKPPVAQNTSDSAEMAFARHFQIPANQVTGFPHPGILTRQYTSSPMVSQGSHLPFATGPDLNVSLPAAKSSFEQPNGNEVQQPDLALQL